MRLFEVAPYQFSSKEIGDFEVGFSWRNIFAALEPVQKPATKRVVTIKAEDKAKASQMSITEIYTSTTDMIDFSRLLVAVKTANTVGVSEVILYPKPLIHSSVIAKVCSTFIKIEFVLYGRNRCI